MSLSVSYSWLGVSWHMLANILHTQLKAMKALLHEYEAFVAVEEMLDCIGYPFCWGLLGWTR